MGSCVSVHRNPHSAMKLKVSFGSKADKLVIPSPIKDHPSIAEPPIGGLSHKAQWSPSQPITPFRDFGMLIAFIPMMNVWSNEAYDLFFFFFFFMLLWFMKMKTPQNYGYSWISCG